MRNIKIEVAHGWIATLLNSLASLLILPLVSRVFDDNTFGVYLYLLTAISLFITFCDYGFSLTITQRIAQAKDARHLHLVASQALYLKFFLIVISCALCALMLSNEQVSEVLIVAIMGSIGALQPNWYFLGINKNSINDWLVAIGKILVAILAYAFISNTSTLVDLMVLHIMGAALSLVGAWSYLIIKENFRVLPSSIFELIRYLRSDFSIAMSIFVTSGYTIFPAIILGHISGMYTVYQYSSIEKIFKSVEYILTKALTILFPVVAKKYCENKEDAISLINRVSMVIFLIGLVIIFASILFGKQFLFLFYGPDYTISTEFLLIMSTIPLLGSLSVVWGNLGVINTKKYNIYFLILASGSFINLTLIFVLANRFGALGAGLSLFVSYCFMVYMMRRTFNLDKNQ